MHCICQVTEKGVEQNYLSFKPWELWHSLCRGRGDSRHTIIERLNWKLLQKMRCSSVFSQKHPGPHPKQCGQQGEGGDSSPLLCSGETSPGVLHPALEPSAQERHGPVGVGPEEGHKNGQQDETPLLWEKAQWAGAIQSAEEKAAGRPYSSLSVPEGGLQQSCGQIF